MTITTAGQYAAEISPCGRYRYALGRRWGDGGTVAFVMLNPSTADATTDDPTIRRCMGFAKAWGHGGLVVANLYGYRATKPADLWKSADPIGPDNDQHLVRVASDCDQIVAAWGANARPDRIAGVLALPGMDRLHVLALTKDGQPRHPLYLRGDLVPQPWSPTTGGRLDG